MDSYDSVLRGTNDLIIVDGTVTNLTERQIIQLNRSRADPLTGRFGTTPITRAIVEVVVDSLEVIACHETIDGSYQLPSDFKGRVNHAYQLRFALPDGTRYQSTQQIMRAVPAIINVKAQFNPTSLPAQSYDGTINQFRAAHELYVDWQDPSDQQNYYRWDWDLYEKQDWCRSCSQGVYAVYAILPNVYRGFSYVSGNALYEDCFIPVVTNNIGQPPVHLETYVYDYSCRTQCWEVLHSYNINVFTDQYSNGGLNTNYKVAQIPYYTHAPCLVELRQSSLSSDAYRYFKLFQEQTQNTGGLADTPPSALVGNIRAVANSRESVIGYFTASEVSAVRYWLDRKDATGLPLGATDPAGPSELPGAELFYALNLRQPKPEPTFPPPKVQIYGGPSRPPTAVCVPGNSRTPFKPEGWRD